MPAHHLKHEASRNQLAAARAFAGKGLLSGSDPASRPDRVTVMRRSSVLAHSPQEVLDLCMSREGFPAMMPDPFELQWSSTERGELGGTYDFRWLFKGILPVRWTAFVDSYTEGREFSDIQMRGIFRYYHHTHTCEPHPEGCFYTDTVVFRSFLGPHVDRLVMLPQLRHLFGFRHGRMAAMLDLLEAGTGIRDVK